MPPSKYPLSNILQHPAWLEHWALRVGIRLISAFLTHMGISLEPHQEVSKPILKKALMEVSALCFFWIESKGRRLLRKEDLSSKPVWADSVNSCRLEAGHREMETLLSHFSTARASSLKKKPNIPLERPAKCLLKREEEGQYRTLSNTIWSGPQGRDSWLPGSETHTLGSGRLAPVHPWPSNPSPQLSSLCWRMLATDSCSLSRGPMASFSSLIYPLIQLTFIEYLLYMLWETQLYKRQKKSLHLWCKDSSGEREMENTQVSK